MIEFIDNVPTYKGRKIITYPNGTQETVTITNADEPVVDGTPINRENMMAIQGFIGMTTEKQADGSILQTNAEGQTLLTVKNSDGSITQTFTGDKVITKTITINGNIISEVIS